MTGGPAGSMYSVSDREAANFKQWFLKDVSSPHHQSSSGAHI